MSDSSNSSSEDERKKPFVLCGFFRLDVPREEEEEHIKGKGRQDSIALHAFITRNDTQAVLVSLLLLDVLILFIELFLDGAFPYCSNIERVGFCDVLNTSSDASCAAPILSFECLDEPKAVKLAETVLYYFTLVILFTFNFESAILLYSLGFKEFVRNLGNVFDVVVITTSIVLEILLHEDESGNAGGILIAARLWRFLRIGHGITFASKRRAGAKKVLEALPDTKEEEPPYWTDPVFSFFRLQHDEDLLHEIISKVREERGRCMHWLAELLHKSPRFQIVLVVLLLVDVCILFASIFIDAEVPICSIVKQFSECDLDNPLNFTTPVCYSPLFDVACQKDSKELKLAKNVLYYASISILCFFEVEVLCRWLVLGTKEFFRSLGNIFDMLIITLSLTLEVVYHEVEDNSAAGVLIIARIWRFIRISHGILYAGGGARREQAKRMIQKGAVEAFLESDDEEEEDHTRKKKKLTPEQVKAAEDL